MFRMENRNKLLPLYLPFVHSFLVQHYRYASKPLMNVWLLHHSNPSCKILINTTQIQTLMSLRIIAISKDLQVKLMLIFVQGNYQHKLFLLLPQVIKSLTSSNPCHCFSCHPSTVLVDMLKSHGSQQ